MSKNVLIVDAGIEGAFAKGELNHHYVAMAKEILVSKGYNVTITDLNQPYEVKDQQEKFLAADFILVQFPGYWMAGPWQLKRYFDEVFSGPITVGGDGRHRGTDAKYGTGGVHTQKRYMLSSTWNAPLSAFDAQDEFWGGIGIDGALKPYHKTFEFLGLKQLPTFVANDVIKNPSHDEDFARFKELINANF